MSEAVAVRLYRHDSIKVVLDVSEDPSIGG